MIRLALIYFLAIVGFLLLVDFGFLPNIGNPENSLPFVDKVGHFLMCGILALLVNAALIRQNRWSLLRALTIGTLIVLIGSTLEEYSNLLTIHRRWSWGDLAANYLGVLCLGVLPFLIRRQPSTADFSPSP